jgi:hypothetical protein
MTVAQKELNNIKTKAAHWYRTGGVVVDVATLLESLARINGRGLSEFDADKLLDIQRSATLVASHALRPVITALNEEHDEWYAKNPEPFTP